MNLPQRSLEILKRELATAKAMMNHNLEGFKGGWLGNQYLYWKTKKEDLERQIANRKKKQ